jgi:hypothetical protein
MTITILKVLQTTSVDKFNAIFEGIERERLVNEVLQQTGQKTAYTSKLSSVSAGVAYHVHCEQGNWTGVPTTGTGSPGLRLDLPATPLRRRIQLCCGDKHMLSDCKKPKSEARIEQNKNKMYDNVKKKGAEKAGSEEAARAQEQEE